MGGIGLVLGAGGIVGHAYHVGTLAAVAEAAAWDPRDAEIVVGTSAGSVVGAMLRAGVSVADLYARSTGGPLSADGARLFARLGTTGPPPFPTRPRRLGRVRPASPRLLVRLARKPWTVTPSSVAAALLPEGEVPNEHVRERVAALYDPDRSWPERPFWACVVRLDDGARVVLGRDSKPRPHVAVAVQASSAIPAWFSPVVIDGVKYVDGGAWSPTNADLVAGLGLDALLVSSPMSAARAVRLGVDTPVRAAYRLRLAREVAAVRAAGTPVVTLQPSTDDLGVMGSAAAAMDPARHLEVARQARETALRRLEDGRILKLLVG